MAGLETRGTPRLRAPLARLAAAALLLGTTVPAPAGEQLRCPLPDGGSFEFDGRHGGVQLHKLFMFHSTTPPNTLRWAYQVTYRHRDGRTSVLPFRDDQPRCERYGRSGTTLYGSTAYGRVEGPSRWSQHWLVTSEDDGRTFSDNRHPYRDPPRSARVVDQLVVPSEARFGVQDGHYLMEFGQPNGYEQFLVFRSSDQGQHWAPPETAPEPLLFEAGRVARARDIAATGRWIDLVYRAGREACARQRGPHCDAPTTRAADARWEACRKTHRSRDCLRLLEPPEVILAPAPAAAPASAAPSSPSPPPPPSATSAMSAPASVR